MVIDTLGKSRSSDAHTTVKARLLAMKGFETRDVQLASVANTEFNEVLRGN